MFEWVITVAGALLCLVYCCFLSIVGRNQKVKFGKVGPVVGVIGALMLAAMAVVGPPRNLESEKAVVIMENEQHVPQRNLLHKKLISVYFRTLNKRGKPPTKSHVAYEDENGKLSWILKENYIKILTKKYKEEAN